MKSSARSPHHRLICRKCGRMDQVGWDTFRSLVAKIDREQRFEVDMDHLALFGLCQDCQHPKPAAKSRVHAKALCTGARASPNLRRL